MDVLKANQAQYIALNGYKNGNSELLFVKDYYDNNIVGLGVLTDKHFLAIRLQLEELESIVFKPKENPAI